MLKGEKERRERKSVALLAQFRTSSGANGKSKCFAHLPIFCPSVWIPMTKES
jgi:hypothetical protein